MEWKKYNDCKPHKHIEKILIFDGKEIDIAWIAPDESLFIDYYNPRIVVIDDKLFWMPLPNEPEYSKSEHWIALSPDIINKLNIKLLGEYIPIVCDKHGAGWLIKFKDNIYFDDNVMRCSEHCGNKIIEKSI